MSAYIEELAARVEAAFAKDENELRAVLWDIRAESWEDGVMWKGGVGTIRPEREPNPYREPPLVLPTEPKWGIVVFNYVADPRFGEWFLSPVGSPLLTSHCCGNIPTANIAYFIPLTPEQVERIEKAR